MPPSTNINKDVLFDEWKTKSIQINKVSVLMMKSAETEETQSVDKEN